MSNDSYDRRAARRVTYHCEVECEGSGMAPFSTRISDLSIKGAFIDSMLCIPVGTVLKLRFNGKNKILCLPAEICYTMEQIGMGVRFLELSQDDLMELEMIVQNQTP